MDIYLPLVLSAAFGACAPWLASRLPPAIATWLLSIGSVVCAAGSAAALGLLAWTLVSLAPQVAAQGHWSAQVIRAENPVPTPVALAALVALLAVVVRTLVAAWRRGRGLQSAYRTAAELPAAAGKLVVVDDDTLPACAVPGRPGKIVMPATLLRRLDGPQRRAVLGHERAHLDHRHHLHLAASGVAAANPLLAALPQAMALATERWADEAATGSCARHQVADALRVAAAATPGLSLGAALGAATNHLAARLTALAAPPPRPVLWRVLTLAGLAVGVAVTTLAAAHNIEHLSEIAGRAYRITNR